MHFRLPFIALTLLLACSAAAIPAFAQQADTGTDFLRLDSADEPTFDGTGLDGGLEFAKQIDGPVHLPVRVIVLRMLGAVLDLLALASVVVLIGAGILLILSFGGDEARIRAKRTVLHVCIGLLIVTFARVIIMILTVALPASLS
jgi:hypothetical protein